LAAPTKGANDRADDRACGADDVARHGTGSFAGRFAALPASFDICVPFPLCDSAHRISCRSLVESKVEGMSESSLHCGAARIRNPGRRADYWSWLDGRAVGCFPNPKLMPLVLLRPATDQSSVFLRRLYATTRDTEMKAVPWQTARKESFLDAQFQARESHCGHTFPKAQNLIVFSGDLPIGRLRLNRVDLEILIVDFALLPEYRGKGIGAELIRELQREAREAHKKLTGTVDRFSRAVSFWRSMDFQIDETQPLYLPMVWRPPSCKV
jgi:GNAT superfamily N-acetyltransferase